MALGGGALGLFIGLTGACTISVNDGWGDADDCYEAYQDCLDDAFVFGSDAVMACEALLDSCLESCDEDAHGDTGSGGSGGSGDGDGDSGDGDGDSGDGDSDSGSDDGGIPRADTGDDGETGDGDGDGDGDGIDPACFEIHATCVAEAQTLQDIEACEALFDHCIDPGPCDDPECAEPGCPQDELDVCVADYAGCAGAAGSAEAVLVCEAEFDGCIAQFDVGLCLPNYDDDLVLECLGQHELCVACASDADELAACMTVFDNCLEA